MVATNKPPARPFTVDKAGAPERCGVVNEMETRQPRSAYF